MNPETKVPHLLGKTDIARRWGVSKQRLIYWAKQHEDFPKPAANVHNGKTPLFLLKDVMEYEEKRSILKQKEKGL